jgi:hypothetical protein
MAEQQAIDEAQNHGRDKAEKREPPEFGSAGAAFEDCIFREIRM